MQPVVDHEVYPAFELGYTWRESQPPSSMPFGSWIGRPQSHGRYTSCSRW